MLLLGFVVRQPSRQPTQGHSTKDRQHPCLIPKMQGFCGMPVAMVLAGPVICMHPTRKTGWQPNKEHPMYTMHCKPA